MESRGRATGSFKQDNKTTKLRLRNLEHRSLRSRCVHGVTRRVLSCNPQQPPPPPRPPPPPPHLHPPPTKPTPPNHRCCLRQHHERTLQACHTPLGLVNALSIPRRPPASHGFDRSAVGGYPPATLGRAAWKPVAGGRRGGGQGREKKQKREREEILEEVTMWEKEGGRGWYCQYMTRASTDGAKYTRLNRGATRTCVRLIREINAQMTVLYNIAFGQR